MKKVIVYLLILALLVNISIADDFYNAEEVTMDISISGNINIHPNVNNYNVDYLKTQLFLYPTETWRQKITFSNIQPEAEITDSINFEWNDVEEEKLNFKANYLIETNQQLKKIKKKINFPLTNLPKEYDTYTKPTENIDSDNKEIEKLANSIAAGEDDLYIVTNKLAAWVEDNIKYNLNTLTEEISQKSSWVLLNKFGVCDEITNLFIAMVRSLGIPARFISGVAYTNWNDMNDWGSHAWAEVYFPDYGWVPFDITYRQLGFIDLSHINLMQSTDSSDPSTKYEWKASGVLVEPANLDINVTLKSKKEKTEPLIALKSNIYEENIGFGSYNIIEAEVKNLNDYYISTELYLSSPKEIELADKSKKYIVLKPNEIKKKYWLIKLKKELDEKYVYTFPISVASSRGTSHNTDFYTSIDDVIYSRSEMQEILDKLEGEEEKIYSKNIELGCNPEKNEYYIDETLKIDCSIKNTGNIALNNLNLCLKKKCQKFDLGISQETHKIFYLNFSNPGNKENIIIIENNEVSKLARISYIVIDKPNIKVTDLDYPDEVSYNDKFNIKFTIFKASKTTPKNIDIEFKGKHYSRTWELEALIKEHDFVLDLSGKDLNAGKNSFTITMNYEDEEGKKYSTKEDFYITLSNVNLMQRIILFFRNLI